MIHTITIVLYFLSAAISAGFLFVFWKQRDAGDWVWPSMVIALSTAVWAFGQAMELYVPTLEAKIAWGQMQYLGIVWLSPAWFVLAMQRTNWRKWLTRRIYVGLAVMPLITIILIFTNAWHHLMWSSVTLDTDFAFPVLAISYGGWFTVQTIYAFGLQFVGIGALVSSHGRHSKVYRQQNLVLMIALLLPLSVVIFRIFDISFFTHVDVTPILLTISVSILAIFTLNFRLFDIAPIARLMIMNNLNIGIIIINERNQIVEMNPAAQTMLGLDGIDLTGQEATRLPAYRPELAPICTFDSNAHQEISILLDDALQYYAVEISTMKDEKRQINGRILTLIDITERKKAETAIEQQNQFLNTIIDSLENPFYVIDVKDYSIQIANKAARELGVRAMNTCYALTHRRDTPCDGLEHPCPLTILRNTQEPVTVEHIHFDAAGKPRNMEVHASPIFNDAGEVVQMIEYSLDITERKVAEAQFRQLSRAVEQSGSSIVITNLDGEIEFVNPAFTRTVGYTPEEVVGQNPRVLQSGQHPPQFYETMWEVLMQGETWHGEMINKRKDGSLYWEHATISPITDTSGAMTGYLAIKDDISDRKQAEKTIRQLSRAVEQSPSTIVITDLDGTIEFVNPAFSKITGYTAEEAIGQNPRILQSGEHDEAFYKEMWRVLADGETWQGEMLNKRKDGSTFWESATISPVMDAEGKITHYLAIKEDISDRKRADAELQVAYQGIEEKVEELTAVNTLIQALSRTTTLQDALNLVSRTMVEQVDSLQCRIALLNQEKTELTIVAHYSENAGQLDPARVSLPMERNFFTRRTFETGQPIYIPHAQTNPDTESSTRQLMRELGVGSLLLLPLLARGEVIGTIAVDSELPDRAFSDEEIRLAETIAAQIANVIANARLLSEQKKAQQEAEEANKAKSVFLANMSHELRTPMNAILGFAQLMQLDPDITATQEDRLQTIGRSGEHLLELINDVLEMSKIEAGRMELSENSFDLHKLLDEVVSLLTMKAQEKDLSLNIQYPADLPQYVRTDEPKLRQVLINLIGNAIKFTKKGGVEVMVQHSIGKKAASPHTTDTGFLQHQQYTLTFAITDSGCGVDEDALVTIFDPFIQAKNKHGQQGTGLGLPISRRFVQMMGGDMYVENKIEGGATFTFDIQASSAASGDVVLAERLRQVVGLAAGQKAYRILLVEDNEINRSLLMQILEPIGFEVRGAENGRVAINHAVRWKPDLILMDMQMPVMDGLDATREIKAKQPDTPIIALTAGAFEHDRTNALAAGCDDFMTKPVNMQVLFQLLKKYAGVQFIYDSEEETDGLPVVEVPLSVDDLTAVSSTLRQELHTAIIRADRRQAGAVIDEIRKENGRLADKLNALLKAFQFDKLAELTQQ